MKLAVFQPVHLINNNVFDSSMIQAFVYLSQKKNWQDDRKIEDETLKLKEILDFGRIS